jgi:SRSO17 transposase
MTQVIETIPQIELKPEDVHSLLEELRDYHAIYSPLFYRSEHRKWSQKYLQGLMLDIDRKSIEPMVLALEGADPNAVRAMQQFISEGSWDDEAILRQHWREVDKDLGDDQGVLVLDGSDFLKQGKESVGVKRQYCGEVGKRANCQAGVYLNYTTEKGYTLLDRRLYLPDEWISGEEYAGQRKKCKIPDGIKFKTKPELGWDMIEAIHQEKVLRYRWLCCDEAFGRDTAFLDKVHGIGINYFAEVPHDTRVWLSPPGTFVPQWRGKGPKPTKKQVEKGEPRSQKVEEIANNLPDQAWTRRIIKEGSKGTMVADFAVKRVVAVRDGLPGPQVWLILRRNCLTGELKTYLSNASIRTPFETLVRMSGMRWPIETTFEDCKQYLGMRDYEVRTWRGWHHHMTLCILAHFFLVRMRLRFKKKAPMLTIPQVRLLLTAILPKRSFDVQLALEILGYRQKRNYLAYLSHRKKRERLLNKPLNVSL